MLDIRYSTVLDYIAWRTLLFQILLTRNRCRMLERKLQELMLQVTDKLRDYLGHNW